MYQENPTRITAIGNALVDILIHETDQFLLDHKKEKGGMTYSGDADIQHLLAQTAQKPKIVPGGAACNTILGVGMLGGKARYIGQRGDDMFGTIFENFLTASQVETRVSVSSSPTGKCLSVITPDAQRSMFTFLGASVEMSIDSITEHMFKDSAIALIEGYLVFNPALILASLEAARKAGALIALDLASFEVVNRTRTLLDHIVHEYVDILLANEDEAAAFTGHENEEKALAALSENVTYGVLKLGKNGSLISHNGQVTKIDPVTGEPPIDTTGAGDLWAAGFLYGIAHGRSIEKSGHLASACGYEVCQVIGASIPDAGWEKIRALL